MKNEKRPLVGIVISFIFGISVDYFFSVPFFLIFPAIIITLIIHLCLFTLSPGHTLSWFIVRQTRIVVLSLLVLMFLTGILYHHFRSSSFDTDNISKLINTEKIPVRLRGIVITQPVSKPAKYSPLLSSKQQSESTTFLLRLGAIHSRRDWKETTGVIKANVYHTKHEDNTLVDEKDSLENKIKYGDRIDIIGTVSTPSSPGNPGQFNYKKYLHRQKPRIEAIFSVANAGNIKLISKNHGNYFYAFIYNLKKELNGVIKKHIKEESIPLVGSILLGNREKIPEGLMDSFLKTGTIHFLAISGLHVGILVISLHYLLRLPGLKTKHLSIIIITFAFLYAVITGMKTPITRAFIMVAVYYGAFIFNRRWDLINSIAAAVFIILLINPADLFNVGFQLSVLAVLGIIYIPNKIENFFWQSTLLVEKLQAKEERNEFWFLLKKYCRKTFCVSLAAWIAVMPLIAFYFHIITPLAVLLNIIVLPLIWIILVSGFIVLLIGLVVPILVTPFAWLTSYSVAALENVVSLFSSNIKAFFYTSGPSWIWIIVYYIIVILFILRERYKLKMAHALIVTLAVSNAFIFSDLLVHNNKKCLKLTCFDVKHGTAIFIKFPNGKNMLFDTGTWSNYDVGNFVVAPFLWQEGIKKIDTVVISHEHNDHCNGIPSLIERFKIGNVFVHKFFLQSGNKRELLRYVTEKDIKTGLLANGLEIKGYGPAKITVLSPPDKDTLRTMGFPLNTLSTNDTSTVLLIEYQDHKILLCADIGETGIDLLLSGRDGLAVDVIQVPHHGGFNERTEALIKNTRSKNTREGHPFYAIISGTEKSVSASTIEAYKKSGANLSKTYEDGAITFTISKEDLKVSKFLKEQISD